jgi:polyisoprenoid-binding protein YceI
VIRPERGQCHRRAAFFVAACVSVLSAAIVGRAQSAVLRFRVNPQESRFTATVDEPLAAVRGSAAGSFQIVRGEITGDPDDAGRGGRVTLAIDATSYRTNSEARDRAVKARALEVDKFPQATFESSGVPEARKIGESSAELRIAGRLTLHGVSREITVPVAVRLEGGRLIADGRTVLRLADYGIPRLSLIGFMKIGDSATVEFHVVADPQ